MSHLLVLVGERVGNSHVREVINFARERGFQLLASNSFQAGEWVEEKLQPLPHDFLEEWGNSTVPTTSAEEIEQAFQSMRIEVFTDFQSRSAISTWRSLDSRGVGAIFPAMVRTMRHLELRFSDWDLVSEGGIDDYDFTVRTRNCLLRAGTVDLAILKHLTDAELLDIRNFGGKCLEEIRGVTPSP